MHVRFVFGAALGVLSLSISTASSTARAAVAPSVERFCGWSILAGASKPKASFVSIGGVVYDPLSMPRVGLDVYLPSGLGVGVAVGYGSVNFSNEKSTDTAASVWIFAPRVGYRIPIASWLDVIPRASVSIVGVSIGENSSTLYGVVFSPEIVAALRTGPTFHILAALAYDRLLGDYGDYFEAVPNAASLWFGLGAYL
jgi:hypothetical protein